MPTVGDKLPVLCIVGPTATGKSDLGVFIAKEVGGEILSADSMQVYRKMDIGTAKLSTEEMNCVPHHLIDLVNPDDPFTVADWVRAADGIIASLHRKGVLPIVVGGTGLYTRAITHNLDFAEKPGAAELRDKWRMFLEKNGPMALHDELMKQDEVTARRLHPHDTRRVTRALEVIELNNRPLSQTYDWARNNSRYHTIEFGLTMSRAVLYDRVNRRVDLMMDKGLDLEVEGLLSLGYGRDLTSMQAIGYKELVAFLFGESTRSEAVLQIKQNTRRFVKRQLSWFRRNENIQWLEKDDDGILSEPCLDSILRSARKLVEGIHNGRHE